MGVEGADQRFPHEHLAGATISQLRQLIDAGELTVARLTEMYIERIKATDWAGPRLRSVIELNPDAYESAVRIDRRRAGGRLIGPLDGIPVLVKDNIDTGDAMQTTAGSLALAGRPAAADAPVVAELRRSGAVILGKTNLSEWANFRSSRSSSGWSARGRQTLNPHVLDRSPSGSSSGSAVAVAAGLCAAAVGTETAGSIISPASMNGIVGFKPAVGRVSQAGIVPISASQDTAGPLARSIADAWALYLCIAGRESQIDLGDGPLDGCRIGVVREHFTGYSEHTDRIFEEALLALRDCGAEVLDPVPLPGDAQLRTTEARLTVLLYEFKAGINQYLASRAGLPVRSLDDVIQFNLDHASEEMPYFGQELLLKASRKSGLDAVEFLEAKQSLIQLARTDGIDAAVARYGLDAIAVPSEAPAFVIDPINGDRSLGNSAELAAVAGYPHITVPAGFAFGLLPVGLSLFGTPERELEILRIACAFEKATSVGRPPRYIPTLPLP